MTATIIPDLSDLPVRFSHLKAFGRSAMHGLHARTTEMKSTIAMQRGTAVDALIYGTRKVVGCPMPRNEKHAAYQAFMAENADAEILTMAEYEKARVMADAIRSSKAAEPWLKGAHQETLLFDWNGLNCRTTPDTRGDGFLTELKTTADGSPGKFQWHAIRMAYHAQMWLQGIGCEARGHRIERFFIVCAESNAPYPVTVYEWDAASMDMGYRLLMLWAERMKNSISSRYYPPYSDAIVPLGIPDEMPELVYETEDEK